MAHFLLEASNSRIAWIKHLEREQGKLLPEENAKRRAKVAKNKRSAGVWRDGTGWW